jgi:glycosyltransferase involved in cell wall biosynthesis
MRDMPTLHRHAEFRSLIEQFLPRFRSSLPAAAGVGEWAVAEPPPIGAGRRLARRVWHRLAGTRPWEARDRQAQLDKARAWCREEMARPGKPVLLYVVPYDVVKLQTGGSRRIGGMAQALAQDYRVFILSLSPSARPLSVRNVCPGVWMLAIPASREFEGEAWKNKSIQGLAGPLVSFAGGLGHLPEFEALIETMQGHAAAWVVASPFAWPPLRTRVGPGVPVIYDAHDNLPVFFQEGLRCRDPAIFGQAEALEKELEARSSVAAFCTEQDRLAVSERIATWGGTQVVVPNGVDVDGCLFAPPAQAREYRLQAGLEHPVVLFAGSNFKPNHEAVDWMVRELAPGLPHVQFVVMGMYLGPYHASGGAPPGPNVVFAGPVPEAHKEAIYALSDLALAPMKTGTGSSLKIPDYVAHGKVVVGTPVGLRGFEELRTFESVVATEDVDGALATVVERLAQDPEAYTEPCRLARDWVANHLDWPVAARPLLDALRAVVPEAQ